MTRNGTENIEAIWRLADELSPAYIALSDEIWGMPEIAYAEFRSSAAQQKQLEKDGFRVTAGIAGLPTAFVAEAGDDGPIIAFLGEFDALPGLSQEAGVAEHKPLPGDGSGHGCGHNMLGTAAMLAATALKEWLKSTGAPGRVRYYGCPAEEAGGGKVFMTRAGAFDGVAAAITWHPSSHTRVDEGQSLANMRMLFRFHGVAAHAAAAPHLGRSALDAVELMNVGTNYLREHMPPDARVHYAILDTGGTAANVVQAKATVSYAVRARDLADLNTLVPRVIDIARGAALMTGTTMDHEVTAAYSSMLPNTPLRQVMHRAMTRLGPVPFDAADRAYAAQIQQTLSREHIAADFRHLNRPVKPGLSLFDDVVGMNEIVATRMSSTDVADVSWVTPTIEGRIATHAIGTPAHTWQITAQGKAPAAHKGLVHAAKVMAATGADLLADPALLESVRDDHQRRIAETPYQCPLPETVQAPVLQPPSGHSS